MNTTMIGKALTSALEKSLVMQAPAARTWVRREREQDPRLTPTELIGRAERRFVAAVTAMGALAGASTAAPGVGTVAGAAANLAEVGAFLEANVFLVLVTAEVHGALPEDPARLRALVLANLVGDASTLLSQGAGRLGRYWGREVADGVPTDVIQTANRVLGHRFLTRWGRRQGMLLLGRELPAFFGAAIGGVGNRMLAKRVVAEVADAFGPPPFAFPEGPTRAA